MPYYFDKEVVHELEAKNADIFEMTRHSRGMDVAWSADGKLIAAAVGTQVRVWDAASGERLHIFDEDKLRVCAVAFSPDCRSLAAGGWDRVIRIWNLETGEKRADLPQADGNEIAQLRFLKDNRTVVCAMKAKPFLITLWDIQRQAVVGELRLSHPSMTRFEIGAHERRILTYRPYVKGAATVQMWSLPELKLIASVDEIDIRRVAFDVGGERFIAGTHSKSWWYSATDGSVISEVPVSLTGLGNTIAPCGQRMAKGNAEGEIKLFDLNSGADLQLRPMRHLLRAQNVCFSPDGKQLASIGGEGAVKVWDSGTGRLVRDLQVANNETAVIDALTTQIERKPTPFTYDLRAIQHLRQEEWLKAAEDFQRSQELQPAATWHWLETSIALATRGELERHRVHCVAMLERFGASERAGYLEHTAKCCLLIPETGLNLEQLSRLADRAVELDDADAPYHEWRLFAQGLARFRTENYEESLAAFGRTRQFNQKLESPNHRLNATCLLLSGMCRHYLGAESDAAENVRQALAIMESDPPQTAVEWLNWMEFEILYREAKPLFPAITRPVRLPAIQEAGVSTAFESEK